MKIYSIALLALLAVGLRGCDPGASGTCPQAKTYSPEFIQAAGEELDIIAPQAPHLVQMLKDYDVTLRAIRHCIKSTRKQ
jgi:hypothetical protein